MRRNWDNLISLSVNATEFVTGVGAFYSAAMTIHGGLNIALSICKITYTTIMADMYGDDYADGIDSRLPDTALGFVGYMMGSFADTMVSYTDSALPEKEGALFDLFDTGCRIALSFCAGKFNKAVDSFVKEVGSIVPKNKLVQFQKYLESAEKFTAVNFIKGIIENIKQIGE